jgi:hypothetical protein
MEEGLDDAGLLAFDALHASCRAEVLAGEACGHNISVMRDSEGTVCNEVANIPVEVGFWEAVLENQLSLRHELAQHACFKAGLFKSEF